MDPKTVRQAERLTALKTALAANGVDTKLEVLPLPYLTVPMLHLSGHRVGVSVVLGRAAPDVYTWGHGNYAHPAADPAGAAERLAEYVRDSGATGP